MTENENIATIREEFEMYKKSIDTLLKKIINRTYSEDIKDQIKTLNSKTALFSDILDMQKQHFLETSNYLRKLFDEHENKINSLMEKIKIIQTEMNIPEDKTNVNLPKIKLCRNCGKSYQEKDGENTSLCPDCKEFLYEMFK